MFFVGPERVHVYYIREAAQAHWCWKSNRVAGLGMLGGLNSISRGPIERGICSAGRIMGSREAALGKAQSHCLGKGPIARVEDVFTWQTTIASDGRLSTWCLECRDSHITRNRQDRGPSRDAANRHTVGGKKSGQDSAVVSLSTVSRLLSSYCNRPGRKRFSQCSLTAFASLSSSLSSTGQSFL